MAVQMAASSSTTRILPLRPLPVLTRVTTGATGATPEKLGRETRTVVPTETVDSTAISPPSAVTMPWHIDRPRPVPISCGLVVKKGSKMRGRSSDAIPQPVSRISMKARPSSVHVRTSIWLSSARPGWMAWTALMKMLKNTSVSRASFASTGGIGR